MKRPIGRVALHVYVTIVGIGLVLPSVVVIPMSFNDTNRLSIWPDERSLRLYRNFFGDEDWWGAVFESVKIGIAVSLLATTLGTLAALAIARGAQRLGGALNAVVLVPIIIPIVVAALGTYMVFLDWGLAGTTLGLICIHTTIAIPFVVVTVLAGLRGVNPRLEIAARSLGSRPAGSVWLVTLPLIRPSIAVGAFLAFMQSFDEVVMSIFISSPQHRTLPVQMYASLNEDIDSTVAAASSLVLTFTVMAVGLVGIGRLARARGIEETT